ncbi:MAG: GIY-YIG nuclease family protein [Balneolaceae bacterium]
MLAHSTYILYSLSMNRYYVGSTSIGVELRLSRHNTGWSPFTKRGMPWELRYVKSFDTKQEALKWEQFIKKQKSRAFIERLINSEDNELSW